MIGLLCDAFDLIENKKSISGLSGIDCGSDEFEFRDIIDDLISDGDFDSIVDIERAILQAIVNQFGGE